jgi:hypothetical protein
LTVAFQGISEFAVGQKKTRKRARQKVVSKSYGIEKARKWVRNIYNQRGTNKVSFQSFPSLIPQPSN